MVERIDCLKDGDDLLRLVFFCGGSFVSGMGIVLLNLMSALTETGHKVLAIPSGWNDGKYTAMLRANNVPFTPLKFGRIYKSKWTWTARSVIAWPLAALKLRRALDATTP